MDEFGINSDNVTSFVPVAYTSAQKAFVKLQNCFLSRRHNAPALLLVWCKLRCNSIYVSKAELGKVNFFLNPIVPEQEIAATIIYRCFVTQLKHAMLPSNRIMNKFLPAIIFHRLTYTPSGVDKIPPNRTIHDLDDLYQERLRELVINENIRHVAVSDLLAV